MTMNYCGRCGSANGTTARFCRQCGAELGSQAAISSSSPPLNVEFSSKPVMKNPGRESRPSSPEPKSTTEPTPSRAESRNQAPDASKTAAGGDSDPKAISESLRRIRTSGPLIVEAIKKNNDRFNEIIAQSIEGMGQQTADIKREEAKAPSPPPPPTPPPVQKSKKRAKPAQREERAETARPANVAPASARPATARQNNQTGVQATTQSIAQTAAQTAAQTVAAAVAMTQSVTRRTTGFLSGSIVNRSNANTANTGQLAPNAPSTVLVQASGFKPQSGFASKVRIVLIALAVLLGAGAYFKFRDKLLPQAYTAVGDRNLKSPEDESRQYVKQGELDRAQGRYDVATEHFHRALELAPNNPDVRFLLAQTYLIAGQSDEAMRGCQEILRIAPEHLDARLQLAEIYRVRGNWPAAYREYKNIIQLNQGSAQAAAALEAIEKQQSNDASNERTIKNALARRVRQTRPNAPALPGPASTVQVPLVSQRMTSAPGVNPPAALNGATVEESPDPRAVADTHKKLGVRYLNIREFRAAINEFLQAISLTPDDKDLYYFIGSSYHGLGQFAEAYNFYRRVDTGPYVGPAQSGTKQTEKAAREASRRRESQKFQSIKNEQGIAPENNKPNRSFMDRIFNLRQ